MTMLSKDEFVSFCHKNLSTLSGEIFHNYMYLTNKCIPALRLETNNENMTTQDLLQEDHLFFEY